VCVTASHFRPSLCTQVEPILGPHPESRLQGSPTHIRWVGVTDSGKHSSLLRHGVNYDCKSFIVLDPVLYNFLRSSFMNVNKLECLSLAGLSVLVLCLWVRTEPTWVRRHSRVLFSNIRLSWKGLPAKNTLAY
jgi:hypothetical protein